MFRTRDFILLFSAIMFLVVAIGTTLINQDHPSLNSQTVALEPENNAEYTATLATRDMLPRDIRIAQMRSKISQQSFVSEDLPVEEVVDDTKATTTDSVSGGQLSEVIQCPGHQPYVSFWDARDLNLIESEGARILTRGTISSTSLPEVVMQLPAPVLPSNNPSCLGSDVVGIANDGSLIRNDEMALYSIFGSETLLGYALDGFPIYGTGSGAVDTCGGLLVGGQYRYELVSGNATIISCFAATPVYLP